MEIKMKEKVVVTESFYDITVSEWLELSHP